MFRRTPSRSTLVVLAWLLNIAGLLGILTVVFLFVGGQIAQTSDAPPATATRINVIATSPTQEPPRFLPSVTPNPLATPFPNSAPTPFVLASGRRGTPIGLSVLGRPIEIYAFGDGERQLLIAAGIHGGYEWNTIALADELITHLDAHPETIPPDVTLYIIRNINPDGDARSHTDEGRVNENRVDLNRNFPTNWQAEWNRDGCWNDTYTTSGEYPGSEPETKAVMRFFASHEISAVISYHSAALGIFPGGTPWDADSKRLARALATVAAYPYPPVETGCIYTGTLADFAVSMGAAAVDMELSNHHDTDFEMNLEVLTAFLNWQR
jgi:predicted deacylase